jgi:F0F1-type ATP synthase assembly protein I
MVASYGRYAALGVQFVVTMCLLGWAGHWVDGKLGTYPLFMIIGFFLGAVGSFISLLSAVPPVTRKGRGSKKEPGDDPHR